MLSYLISYFLSLNSCWHPSLTLQEKELKDLVAQFNAKSAQKTVLVGRLFEVSHAVPSLPAPLLAGEPHKCGP